MGRRTNKFSKAIKHIKSTEIDDKLAMLEAAPTNNTMGYMSSGVHGEPKPDITITTNPFPTLPLPDFDQDDPSANGRDTSGLFNPSGVHAEGTKILVKEPPGDTSYVLGPMAAMYYTWSYPWTMVGYIRESDRKMVNLARIDGKLSDWDGVSGFNNSWWGGQLTLEQAVWFRDVKKYGNVDNDPANANYRAFYPGPPSNSPDAFGRYFCTTTGEPKNQDESSTVPDIGNTEPIPGTATADEVFAAIMERLRRGELLSNDEKEFLEKYNENMGDEEKVESMLDKLKDHWNQTWEDIKDFPNDLKDFGKDFLNMLDELTDMVPALEYSKDIADSILSNEPKDNSHTITQDDKDKLYDGLNYDNIKINDTKEPYADDNIIEDENGNVRPRSQWPTDENGNEILDYSRMTDEQKKQADAWFYDQQNHPNNTGSVQNEKSEKEMNASAGASNPLAAAGNAQTQVYQNENGQWMFSYHDHAYHNVDSKDPGEVPGIGFINPKAWISSAVHAVSNAMHGRPGDGENTGGMEGYPSNIRGDSIRSFETPLEEMPIEFQNWFHSQQNGKPKNQNNSYKPKGKLISESRKTRILKNIKKPVVLPKEPKKFKVKPKLRTPNKWMGSTPKISKPAETPKEYKQIGGRNLWGKAEYNYNTTQSQERMNQVYELVGDGNMAFDYMLTDSKKLNDEQMEKFWGKNPDFYSYFYGGKKYKLVRKEEMDGDFLVFLVDDHGEKSNILQSELNEKLAEEQERKELEEYNKMNPKEPVSVEKDYMFKKVQKRLKPQIDYKGKPAKKGYPDEPPPEMVNNRHPDFGKRPGSTYYNKLDPQSADAMPQQDDETIDAKVKDAKENPKKDSAMFRRKLDDKMKKERERLAKEEWEKSDWRKELESII